MIESTPPSIEEKRKEILDEMCELGKWYLDEDNVDEALRWLNSAAALGSDLANFELGKMYCWGDGVSKNLPKAAEYFEKSDVCLYDNFDDISCNFGEMYRYGHGVEKNIEKAIFWYELIASCGDNEEMRDSTFALGEIYRDGEGGIQPDGQKAVHYFMKLAFDVSEDYYEIINGARFYEDGQDVPMPYEEHAYFFSSNCGDDAARFALGRMYLYGQAIEKDVYKAAWCFAKTDELDYFENGEVFDLAEMYRTGDDIEKDIGVAVAWYEKIVEWWNSDVDKALYALAEIYFNGDGVEKDIEQALNYYERAANEGNLKASHRLTEIYLNGEGVKKNLNDARYYLNKIIEGLLDKI